jgi:hypothetical protein
MDQVSSDKDSNTAKNRISLLNFPSLSEKQSTQQIKIKQYFFWKIIMSKDNTVKGV